jgi:hypothetical protein
MTESVSKLPRSKIRPCFFGPTAKRIESKKEVFESAKSRKVVPKGCTTSSLVSVVVFANRKVSKVIRQLPRPTNYSASLHARTHTHTHTHTHTRTHTHTHTHKHTHMLSHVQHLTKILVGLSEDTPVKILFKRSLVTARV